MYKNKLFQSSETKNETYAKFRDKNNNLTFYLFWIKGLGTLYFNEEYMNITIKILLIIQIYVE